MALTTPTPHLFVEWAPVLYSGGSEPGQKLCCNDIHLKIIDLHTW